MSIGLVDDAAWVRILHEVAERARPHYEHRDKQLELNVWLKRPESTLEEILKPIYAAMAGDGIFSIVESRFFGPKQVMLRPQTQASN